MLRADFISKLVDGTGLPKYAADVFLSRISLLIEKEIEAKREVRITGVGSFFLSKRQGRTVINPNDPAKKIVVPSMSVIRFSPSKKLKRAARKTV